MHIRQEGTQIIAPMGTELYALITLTLPRGIFARKNGWIQAAHYYIGLKDKFLVTSRICSTGLVKRCQLSYEWNECVRYDSTGLVLYAPGLME